MNEDQFFDKVGTDFKPWLGRHCHPNASKLFEPLDGCYCDCCQVWPGLTMPEAAVSKDHSYIIDIEYTLPDIGNMP